MGGPGGTKGGREGQGVNGERRNREKEQGKSYYCKGLPIK